MDTLQLRTCTVDLRAMRVERDDGVSIPLSAKEARLLEYLALHEGSTVTRETLSCDVLGNSPTVVSRALDAMVRRIRSKIEQDPTNPDHLLTLHGEGYRLEIGGRAPALEAPTFLAAVGFDPTVARPLEEPSLDAHGGTVVARDGDERILAFTNPARAVVFCLGAVEVEPGLRAAVCSGTDVRRVRRILAAATGGQTLASEDVYHQTLAATRVNTEPWRVLGPVRLVRGEPPERLVETGGDGSRSLTTADGNLVAPTTPLVGRGDERTRIEELLHEVRLVTITGTGGVGKTRLALDIGRSWREDGGGAWFCELSGCRTEADVLEAVARTLGIPVRARSDPGRALAALDGDLVVLDNAEQAVPAVRSVVDRFLAHPGGAVLLVTSRERLRSEAEHVVDLGPLPPDDAVVLFRRRAAALGVDVPDGTGVRALVARVDGLPLGIELAAARTEVLTPEELLARLDDRLVALGGDAGRGPRHADLRALVAWSWELCTATEQDVLLACTPFVGSFTIEDVEAVAGEGALDAVHQLRRRGLLRTAELGRLASYAAVRAFVLVTAEPSALEGARDRHARWLARWGAADLRDRLAVTGGTVLSETLVGAVPDLLAAFEHTIDRDPPTAVALFLGAGLAMLRAGTGDRIEPLAQRVLPFGIDVFRIHRLRAMYGAPAPILREVDEVLKDDRSAASDVARIRIAWLLGEIGRCQAMSDEILPSIRASGDETLLADVLHWAALAGSETGQRADVIVGWIREGLALCERRGDLRGVISARIRLGWAALGTGDRESALREARRAVSLAEGPAVGWARLEGLVLLGEIHRLRAEAGPMLRTIEQAMEQAARFGDSAARPVLLANLGMYHLLFTDTASGRRSYEEILDLDRRHGYPQIASVALGNLGAVALAEGRVAEALSLLTQVVDGKAIDTLVATFLPLRARGRLLTGDAAGALVDLDRAISAVRGLRAWGLEAAALRQRALVQARLGDRTGAAADLARAEHLTRAVIGPGWEVAELALARAEVAVAMGDPDGGIQVERAGRALEAIGAGPLTVYGRMWARLRAEA